MRLHSLGIAVLALVLAAPLRAQGMGRQGRDQAAPKEKPHIVTSDSLERLNPISPLIQYRKEIGVPDSLIGRLGAILARLDAANSQMLQQVDSMAATYDSNAVVPDVETTMPVGREGHRPVSLPELFVQIGKHNQAAADEALALLSPRAADRAKRYIDDQRKKFNELLQNSQAGSGRPGG